jgi:hypothetical protein
MRAGGETCIDVIIKWVEGRRRGTKRVGARVLYDRLRVFPPASSRAPPLVDRWRQRWSLGKSSQIPTRQSRSIPEIRQCACRWVDTGRTL